MILFNGPKNYATLVAPLKKIVDDLNTYMDEMTSKIKGLEVDKAQISAEINISKTEIAKSNFTTIKISEMVVTEDIYENEIVDDSDDDSDDVDEFDIEVNPTPPPDDNDK